MRSAEEIIGNIFAFWDKPPIAVTPPCGYANMTQGALLGDGDVGVCIGADHADAPLNEQNFLIGKNDFWTCDEHLGPPPGSTFRHTGNRPLPIGRIIIRLDCDVLAYGLTQQIYTGEVITRFTLNGGTAQMVSYIRKRNHLLVTELLNDSNASLRFSVKTAPKTGDAYRGTEQEINPTRYPVSSERIGDAFVATRQTNAEPEAKWTVCAVMATRVLGAAGSDGEYILAPGETACIVTHVDTKWNPIGREFLVKAAQKADPGKNSRRANRLRWRRFWKKSLIDLNDDQLHRFYYGQIYVIGCCTGNKDFAPGLYGNWLTSEAGGWRYYTLNYNFIAAFYGLYAANRAELVRPMVKAFFDYVPEGKVYSREQYACPGGLAFPVGIGPMGIRATKDDLGQKGNALLCGVELIQYYEYTQNEAYFGSLYPYFDSLMTFWEHNLIRREGVFHVINSGARELQAAEDPATDLGYLRRILAFLVKEGCRMGFTKARIAKFQQYLQRLAPQPVWINLKGTRVFREDRTHERMSALFDKMGSDNPDNLMFLFPGETEGLDSDADTLRMLQDTIREINAWQQGNAFPKIYTMAARAGYDADETLMHFRETIAAYTQTNLLVNVGQGHGIDNTGAIEYIHSMLLQSYDGVIRLFPCMPKGLPAQFKGLLAKGAFLISAALENGAVTDVVIESRAGAECRLSDPWGVAYVAINGKEWAVENGRIIFPTLPGKSYAIMPLQAELRKAEAE